MPTENYKINSEFNFNDKASVLLEKLIRTLKAVEVQYEKTHRSFLSKTLGVVGTAAKWVAGVGAIGAAIYGVRVALTSGAKGFDLFNKGLDAGKGVIGSVGNALGVFKERASKDITKVTGFFTGLNNAIIGTGRAMRTFSTIAAPMLSLVRDMLPLLPVIGMFMGLNVIGQKIVAPSTNIAAQFETQMARIELVLNKTSKAVKEFGDLSLEMGKKSQFSAVESAETIYRIAAATGSPEISKALLKPTLLLATASAGTLDLANAWSTLQQTIAAFQVPETFNEALKLTDQMAKATAVSSLEFSDFLSMVASANDVFVKYNLNSSQTLGFLAAIKRFFPNYSAQTGQVFAMGLREFADIQNLPKLRAILGNIGKDIYDQSGKIKQPLHLYKELAKALNLTKENYENLADPKVQRGRMMLQQLFGSGYAMQSFQIALRTGFTNIESMIKEIADSSGFAEKFAQRMLNTWEEMNRKVVALTQNIQVRLGGVFKTLDMVVLKIKIGVLGFIDTFIEKFPIIVGGISSIIWLMTKLTQAIMIAAGVITTLLLPSFVRFFSEVGMVAIDRAILGGINKLIAKAPSKGAVMALMFYGGFKKVFKDIDILAWAKKILIWVVAIEVMLLAYKHNFMGFKDAVNIILVPLQQWYIKLQKVWEVTQIITSQGQILFSEWNKLTDSQKEKVINLVKAYTFFKNIFIGVAEVFVTIQRELGNMFFYFGKFMNWFMGIKQDVKTLSKELNINLETFRNLGKFIGHFVGVILALKVSIAGPILMWRLLTTTIRDSINAMSAVVNAMANVISMISKLVGAKGVEIAMSTVATHAANTEAASKIRLAWANRLAIGAGLALLGGIGALAITSHRNKGLGMEEQAAKQRHAIVGMTVGTILGGILGGGAAALFSGGAATGLGIQIGMAAGSTLGGLIGGSFADGGKVPGAIGQPKLAVVHGGEEITNPYKQTGFKGSSSINLGGVTMNFYPTKMNSEEAEEFANLTIKKLVDKLN